MDLTDYIKYQKRLIHLYDYSEETDSKYIFYDCYLNEIENIDYHYAYKVEFIKSNNNTCAINIFKDENTYDSIIIE